MQIRNTTILNEHYEIQESVSIKIREGKITGVYQKGEKMETETGEEILDGSNHLFMPGLTDSHMHTGQQLLRGGVLDELPMIWTRVMLPYESTLTPEKMRLSAQLAALEMIHGGTTGFVDAGGYFMEEAAQVYEKAGLKGCLSYSTMDQQGLPESIQDTTESALEKTDELYDRFHKKGNLKVFYSLRSLISCSQELMTEAAKRAKDRKTMLQAHMNEYSGEINFFLERKQLRPYEYLDSLGILDENFLGAHSLMLSDREIQLLKRKGGKVCHCPFSNCQKAVPKTPQLLEQGVSVGLGTDGAAHGGMSLWNEMKIFRSVMNAVWGLAEGNPRIMPAGQILKIVLEGGAAAMGEETKTGKIREGYEGNLIGISLNHPHLACSRNLVNTLVECVNAGDVTEMIVKGKTIMKEGRIQTLDEEKILWEARETYR